MTRLSLRLRSFAAALLALILFIPLTAITLEQAFTNSLSQSMLEQLRVQSLTLISEFEVDDGEPNMPEQLFNDKLNIPGSGLYAFILKEQDLVWQSLSTLNWQYSPQFPRPVVGTELFDPEFQVENNYFLFAYTAEFETSDGFKPVSFYILQDRLTFEEEQQAFANTLWNWLGLIAVLLIALLLFSLNAALKPINQLIDQIKQAESGNINRISAQYPPELEKLKSNINHLLDTEQQQRSRYKNSLSDLAHSLKTPLAVLSGTASMPEESKEPLQQIDNIIQRQLKRAAARAGSGWEASEPLKPVVDKVLAAMAKVYADKDLSFRIDVPDSAHYRADKTDLIELLGNLLDNACKAANSQVLVTASTPNNQLHIAISDDGPGIKPQDREKMLNRGARLDSYADGQGIGMAVVSDLLTAYQGKLDISDSPMGGAQLSITLPL